MTDGLKVGQRRARAGRRVSSPRAAAAPGGRRSAARRARAVNTKLATSRRVPASKAMGGHGEPRDLDELVAAGVREMRDDRVLASSTTARRGPVVVRVPGARDDGRHVRASPATSAERDVRARRSQRDRADARGDAREAARADAGRLRSAGSSAPAAIAARRALVALIVRGALAVATRSAFAVRAGSTRSTPPSLDRRSTPSGTLLRQDATAAGGARDAGSRSIASRRTCVDATLASEDRRFYEHARRRPVGVARAALARPAARAAGVRRLDAHDAARAPDRAARRARCRARSSEMVDAGAHRARALESARSSSST